jgi:exodeoxyribonuclease VII large subunit
VRTVTELTLALRDHVAERFSTVWVRGELTNVRRVASGHVYMALKDAGAVLPAVLWRSSAARLPFDLADGLEVVCRGAIDVYPPHGKYQLVVHEVEPLGHGALRLAFEQMRKRLEAEGLFEAARKVPIPALPRRVALVTSKSGAAVRDLVTVIHRRFPRVEIVLVAVRVQGLGAAADVARGLALADGSSGADVIVVGRGGGSLEDLWAFNEEVVARAIAACVTPVVSAVGHEIDVTIADLVADVRAATPSQAGELVVPLLEDLERDLAHRRARLERLGRTRVDRAWQRVEALATRPVLRDPLARAAALACHLDQVGARLEARSPRAELARRRAAAEDLASRARRGARGRFDAALAAYERRRAQVEALSPLRVLDRGYSLTRLDGTLLKSASQARPGDAISTEVADGVVESRVEAVRPRREPSSP